MIEKELETLVREQRKLGTHDAYILNALKEYLQVYVLYFIYTSPQYRQKLIFTGGTCLRHFYGLERLSVDIDFDVLGDFSAKNLLEDLKTFFISKHKYSHITGSLKQPDRQIRLKFPVLKKAGLARESDSDLLYVIIDISPIPSTNYSAVTTSKNSFGLNYAARHYDLPSLMAGKLHAILTRQYRKGKEGRDAVKGRDYFDLLWFIKKGVSPNIHRLSDMLGKEMDLKALETQVDQKVQDFIGRHKGDYIADMAPLIRDPAILEIYAENYLEEYMRSKSQSFF